LNVRELAHVMALTEFTMPEPDREVNGGEVACVVLTEGVVPDETLRQRAEQQNINILGTKLSTFDAASVLKQLLR